YYSFRLFFVILFSKVEKPHGHHDEHHTPAVLEFCRVTPLAALGAISVFVGFLGSPWLHHRFLVWFGAEESHVNLEILGTTSVLIVAGAALAYALFKDPAAAEKRLE